MLAFNPDFTYAGCDGQYCVQVLPSGLAAWFVVVLGQGYLSTSEKTYPTATIVEILMNSPFCVATATWQETPCSLFTRNPFLLSVSAFRSLSFCQLGSSPLPVQPTLYPLQVYSAKRSIQSRLKYICFILTNDRQFVCMAVTRNPSQTLTKIQKYHPIPLSLIGSIVGDRQKLQVMQQQFAYLQVQQDWLRFTPDLESYIMKKIYNASE